MEEFGYVQEEENRDHDESCNDSVFFMMTKIGMQMRIGPRTKTGMRTNEKLHLCATRRIYTVSAIRDTLVELAGAHPVKLDGKWL